MVAEPLTAAQLAGLGSTLVVAPHPDDETLGCGGLIALLQRGGHAVWALLVSDGAASHPASRRWPAATMRRLRHAEWTAALACLGVPAHRLSSMNLPDGKVPGQGDPAFNDAVALLGTALARARPDTLLVPWRRDPHADHRASHALVQAALAPAVRGCTGQMPRQLEYAVWLHERAGADDRPRPGEMRAWQLDISAVAALKRRAIACHRSQLGRLIDDDPEGFTIPAGMVRRAAAPVETFFETATITNDITNDITNEPS